MVEEVIGILKDAGITVEKISELYYGTWFEMSDENSSENIMDKRFEVNAEGTSGKNNTQNPMDRKFEIKDGMSDENGSMDKKNKSFEIKGEMPKKSCSENIKEKEPEGKVSGGTGICAGGNVTVGNLDGHFAVGSNISQVQFSFLFGEPLVDLKVKYRCQDHGFFIPRKIKWAGTKPYCPECNKPLEVKSTTQEV